jgi:hypothetical protein
MSSRFKIQDATGVVIDDEPYGIMKVITNTAPTAAAAGYGVGCEWTNTAGAAGAILYINQGTTSSATWLAIA